MPPVQGAIEKGLAYLQAAQLPDGSFDSYASAIKQPFRPAHRERTVFTPALILNALCGIPAAAAICKPLAAWLARQHGPLWSFNWWALDAPERGTSPYPDDLDDTFCSLIALYRHNPQLVDATALGAMVKLLIATEQQVGGPYYTWLVGKHAADHWRDVDLAVNANIAYFLRLVADPLPNLNVLMEQAIAHNRMTSLYYTSHMAVPYYLARAYSGPRTAELQHIVTHSRPRTALDQALRLSALAHLGGHTRTLAALRPLLRSQNPDGSWPAAAFCRAGKPFYHGSAVLTTAFALEALQTYSIHTKPVTPARRPARPPDYQALITAAKGAVRQLRPDLRRQTIDFIDRIVSRDQSQEIVCLPQLFAASLAHHAPPPAAILRQLSIANIFGWLAYTIYDSFLDGAGDPHLLSAANAAMRRSIAAFNTAVPTTAFTTIVSTTFDAIDAANTWEVVHCRAIVTEQQFTIAQLPRYGTFAKLAERSLGHTLSPQAILIAVGVRADSEQAAAIQRSLYHYLIARQLQDDLADWEDDLRRGQLTPVVTEVLLTCNLGQGVYKFADNLPQLRQAFWQVTLPAICARIKRYITQAHTEAQASRLLLPDNKLYDLFTRLTNITAAAEAEQAKATAFLTAYKKPLA